ncbi:astacin-like metalloprotease toxin 5 [Actinia tenebrosa]|uniref:Metalloendopeptidase n=1 Tax=Actinia tenebrosa TaxID=6105 RepID=A0A6P8HTK3_ACTTE|nr:astacin-like metalloprotease toxin 5 [Actinia tenebrosa]XP_031556016.1 astacin-like metalloprotease toxin 5 [Actinia tenebrosa]
MYYTILAILLITKGAQAILWEKEEEIISTDRHLVLISGGGDALSERGITNNATVLWPNATVFYSFNETMDQTTRDLVKKGIEMWENKTCLRFKLRTNETDFIMVTFGKNCESEAIGRKGGEQFVKVGTPDTFWCSDFEIAHEFGHAIGFYHEHVRPDRDEYVKICYDNIDLEKKYIEPNFGKKQDIDSRNSPYDYSTFMHYPRYAGSGSKRTSSGNLLPLLVPLKKGPDGKDPIVGQVRHLTDLDVHQANILYGCQGTN